MIELFVCAVFPRRHSAVNHPAADRVVAGGVDVRLPPQ